VTEVFETVKPTFRYVYAGPRNAGRRVLEYSVGNRIGLNLRVLFYNLHTRLLEMSSIPFLVNIPTTYLLSAMLEFAVCSGGAVV
jgi:hypothetical protein